MNALRTSTRLARLVLACFWLTLGVAMASPFIAPRAMEMVCSDGGAMKLVVVDQDQDSMAGGQHLLDCALCLPTFLPTHIPPTQVRQPQPLAYALTPIEQARIAALVGAPLPPRGPPALA
jgi:hypothetical protein